MTQAVIVFQDDVTGKRNAYVSDVSSLSPITGFTDEWLNRFKDHPETKKRIIQKYGLISVTIIDAFYDIA